MRAPSSTNMIFDSIHGFIHYNEWEKQLIDSPPFQRLHYIRQLGTAYLIYPGAVHTRFEHSFGAMEIATQIFDKLAQKQAIPDAAYYRQMVRLAALAHDLGHLPFSHVAERLLLGKGGHEKWTIKIIQSAYLRDLWEGLKQVFPRRDPQRDVIKLSLGEKKCREVGFDVSFTEWDRVVCQIITGDFFGADRIDYLLRDAKYTGLSYGVFDYRQLIEMLRILPASERGGEGELGVEVSGMESCEALLLARHFMHRRIYQYGSVKAYAFHLARFMKTLYKDFKGDVDHYLSFTDNEVLAAVHQASKDPSHPRHQDAIALFTRKKTFFALVAPEGMTEEKMRAVQEEHAIPEGEMYWRLTKRKKGNIGLDFPVLTKQGKIVRASNLSDMSVPTDPSGWVYVTKPYQHLF